ncbi:putative cytochrome P450 [Helianthus debilis subsp. tardiflorus]
MGDGQTNEEFRDPKESASGSKSNSKRKYYSDTDIQNMHYLKMIIKETFRLHGRPILLPKVSRKDCMVDRYNIPVNTRILINGWVCGTDPGSWECWLQAPQTSLTKLTNINEMI